MQEQIFSCSICGWSSFRKSCYTKHFNICKDPTTNLKKQTKQICTNNEIKQKENIDIITSQINITNNEIEPKDNTDILKKEQFTQTEIGTVTHFNILNGAIVELKTELRQTDNKISSIINTCCNIEQLLIDVKKNLKNVDVESANTIQKINKIEDILKDKYFKLNLAD